VGGGVSASVGYHAGGEIGAWVQATRMKIIMNGVKIFLLIMSCVNSKDIIYISVA
jgi:hypothetical protein